MGELRCGPTVPSQWVELVNEAQQNCNTWLSEVIESYLVFMLIRFMAYPQILNSVLGMDLLKSAHSVGEQRRLMLRDVGDSCLLVSGLFPGRIEKKHLKISYFVHLGQFAYGTLSLEISSETGKLYDGLCNGFVKLMDVLQAIRSLDANRSDALMPIQAFDQWHETGSQQAFRSLRDVTGAIPIIHGSNRLC